MPHDPELHVIKPPDLGNEWRTERARQQVESRARHLERLVDVVTDAEQCASTPADRAELILNGFFTTSRSDGSDCPCSCHPRLPESDFHDYGDACPCLLTPEQRRAQTKEMFAGLDEFWASPEGQRITAAQEADEAELDAWLNANPDVLVTSHGGMAPEQWWGTVDGRSFYFRERHDDWRIELDLRPSGRFVRAWKGGDLDDDDNFELKELDEGDVIAEGTISTDGYGRTPVERARFLVDAIRTNLRRQSCDVHVSERNDLELLFGRPLDWCPACGLRLSDPPPA